MTSEATVPEAAIHALRDACYAHSARHMTWQEAEHALTAALPHLSTAIHDAALEEAHLLVKRMRDEWATLGDAPMAVAAADDIIAGLLTLKGKSIPAPAATHRHKKCGTEYVLIGYGRRMQTEDWVDLSRAISPPEDPRPTPIDMRDVAIYRSVDDGLLWARPREEFEDGRFEAIIPAPAEGNEAEAAAGVQAYREKNAETGWTGRYFGFEGGSLFIDKDGNGKLVFAEEELSWEEPDDADPRPYRSAPIAASEMIGLAEYLVKTFPTAPAQAPGELVEQLRELRDRLNGESPQASKWPSIVEDAIAALTRQEQRGAAEVKLEDAAKAAFKQAQSVYRAEYDHFPLSTVWETTDEAVRDGWRKIAAAALAATPVHQEAGK